MLASFEKASAAKLSTGSKNLTPFASASAKICLAVSTKSSSTNEPPIA